MDCCCSLLGFRRCLLAPRVVVSVYMLLWRAALFVFGCVLLIVCRCLFIGRLWCVCALACLLVYVALVVVCRDYVLLWLVLSVGVVGWCCLLFWVARCLLWFAYLVVLCDDVDCRLFGAGVVHPFLFMVCWCACCVLSLLAVVVDGRCLRFLFLFVDA